MTSETGPQTAAAPAIPPGAAARALRVNGFPAPQGSKRAITRTRRDGSTYTNMVESSKDKVTAWRKAVGQAALLAGYAGRPVSGPLRVVVTFRLPRPQSHYGRGSNTAVLRPGAARHPCGRPDVDKLARATLDALTLVKVWADDSQVTQLDARKMYARPGELPGAVIEIIPLEGS